MTATNHTEHYDLSQYTKDDRPTYTGDYNSDMSKIDAAIYAASQAGGMTSIEHTADLTGDGTVDSPLGVADTIARTEDIPSLDGYATTESVTQAIAAAVADRLTAGDIKAGSGINIKTSGNQITISYVGEALTTVVHDDTLTGDGTSGSPLGMIDGNFINAISKSGDEADANKLTAARVYKINGNWKNMPSDARIVSGSLFDASSGNARIQCILAYTDSTGVSMFVRQGLGSLGAASWGRLVKESELSAYTPMSAYNALVKRVAILESQVAALTSAATPAVTGLTAEQLDSLYLDGYNIIKVGTPIHSNESEESSQ